MRRRISPPICFILQRPLFQMRFLHLLLKGKSARLCIRWKLADLEPRPILTSVSMLLKYPKNILPILSAKIFTEDFSLFVR